MDFERLRGLQIDHQIELGGLLDGNSLRMSCAMYVSMLLKLIIDVACDLFVGLMGGLPAYQTAAGPISEWVPSASQSLRAQLPFNTTVAQAGFTSPALRLSAEISNSESPLTTDISRSLSSVSAKCSLVASMALKGAAMATLKYRNNGGPKPRRPTHLDGASSEG